MKTPGPTTDIMLHDHAAKHPSECATCKHLKKVHGDRLKLDELWMEHVRFAADKRPVITCDHCGTKQLKHCIFCNWCTHCLNYNFSPLIGKIHKYKQMKTQAQIEARIQYYQSYNFGHDEELKQRLIAELAWVLGADEDLAERLMKYGRTTA